MNLQLRERPLYWYKAVINITQTQTVVLLSVSRQHSWISSVCCIKNNVLFPISSPKITLEGELRDVAGRRC